MNNILNIKTLKKNYKLSLRILTIVVFVSSILTIFSSMIQLYFDYKKDLDLIHYNIHFIQTSYLPSIIFAVYTLDEKQTESLLNGCLNFPDIGYLEISDTTNKLYKSAGDKSVNKDITQSFSLEYKTPSEKIISVGTLTVSASFTGLYNRLWKKAYIILFSNLLKTFLATIPILIIINHIIVRHLISISMFTRNLNLDKLDQKLILNRKLSKKTASDEIDLLVQSINAMIDNIKADTDKIEKIQNFLRDSEEKYKRIFNNLQDVYYETALDGTILELSPSIENSSKYKREELIGKTLYDIYTDPKERDEFVNIILNKGHIKDYEIHLKDKDDSQRVCSITTLLIKDKHGNAVKLIGSMRDISESKRVKQKLQESQAHLQQAQKMESIGTLAGGIAHDFNNILFPIVGHSEMLLADVSEKSLLRDSLNQIYTSALRASELVKQILTFSRQESGELKLMKMQPIIRETLKLIRSSVPTTIKIKQNLQSDCGPIKADPTQIHQIVMNLATNAYHAMEYTGGEMNIRLKKIELGERDLFHPDIHIGIYACFSISDTGKGMDNELINKIFDPFFTTKETGKGTGMGLSVVHGIVKNMNGAIQVDSKPDKGTEFHVYLPLAKADKEQLATEATSFIQGGTEHILLVDDEKAIIKMEQNMLERLGYKITSRSSSIEALEIFRATPDKFDLVITDMAMPDMPGDTLSKKLNKILPGIPILLCTGFSEIMSEEKAVKMGINGFLLKPIVKKDLSHKIREVLDTR